jgi:hypothetical protein
LTTADDLMTSTGRLDEDGDRALRASAWKIDCDRVESALLEANDIGLHRRRVARCAMTEHDTHDVYRRSVLKRCVWSSEEDHHENLRDLPKKNIS